MKAVEADPKAIWIVKPPASSCGRGIRVISKATAGRVSKSRKCLVQVRERGQLDRHDDSFRVFLLEPR